MTTHAQTQTPARRRAARATHEHQRGAWTSLLLAVVASVLASVAQARADQESEETARPLRSDSAAPYVHRLTLYDHDGAVISPDDMPALPYSPRMTCGKCHDYATISRGWHFNAPDRSVAPGRRGQPWFLIDAQTGTQIPISGRGWPGTHMPEETGLTNWQFVLRFGHHTAGGGFGEPPDEIVADSSEALRWGVSGKLEIDCMFCHSADQQHDPAEAARQIELENFRWAPTAALGLAVVRGAARKAPDDWDPMIPPDPDHPEQAGPTLIYDQRRFDPDDRVFFNITRRPPAERCYFCHFAREVGPGSPARSAGAQDVHLVAGLTCVDCHRNGLDHMITRGYAAEAAERGDPSLAAFTCEGCHLGSDDTNDASISLGGRYGARHPQHMGLPPLHFEKLTCTACHSGPRPEAYAKRFQTALAHGLGLATREREDEDLPHIVAPIFARQHDGKIAPQRLVWPVFWGRARGAFAVVDLEVIRAEGIRQSLSRSKLGRQPAEVRLEPPFDHQQLRAILTALAEQEQARCVCVRDGVIYGLSRSGELQVWKPGLMSQLDSTVKQLQSGEPASDIDIPPNIAYVADMTAPYHWSIGHNVRPASQSLGVNGCEDCHADNAPIYFGRITDADAEADALPMQLMHELRGDDPSLASAWNAGFRFRPAFKWLAFACVAVVGLILLHYVLGGIGAITRGFR